MDKIINIGIIREPLNWAIVVLMVATGFLALALIFPDNSSNQNGS